MHPQVKRILGSAFMLAVFTVPTFAGDQIGGKAQGLWTSFCSFFGF